MRVAFLDKERAIAELTERAQMLVAQDDRVLAVGLFGSLARGSALPSSDADLLIILQTHTQPRWFERISEYAAAFQGTALPVEPFPYTVEELRRLCSQPGFMRTILRDLVFLGGDATILERLQSPDKDAEP